MQDVDRIERVHVGSIELAYQTFGDASDPAVLLVMGLGTQMLAWPDEFCAGLAATGRHVVRFDNRDTGLSTHLDDLPGPSPIRVLLRRDAAPYSIDDMAADSIELLDALGLATVDLVGASMGGFIAQALALRSPGRVRSLTLMMTSTGSQRVGLPAPKVVRQLLRRREVGNRAAAISAAVAIFRLIGSPGYAFDEEYLNRLAGVSFDRAHDSDGYLRQLAACLVQPDRTGQLRRLRIPTLVLHGLADPLVSSSGGMALARTIPGARLVGYWGMGHDLPRELWPEFVGEIGRLTARASTPPVE